MRVVNLMCEVLSSHPFRINFAINFSSVHMLKLLCYVAFGAASQIVVAGDRAHFTVAHNANLEFLQFFNTANFCSVLVWSSISSTTILVTSGISSWQ